MAQIDRIGRLSGPLTVRCSACGHQRVWQPHEARARFGGECTTIDAKRRLVCGACGERRSYMIAFAG